MNKTRWLIANIYISFVKKLYTKEKSELLNNHVSLMKKHTYNLNKKGKYIKPRSLSDSGDDIS